MKKLLLLLTVFLLVGCAPVSDLTTETGPTTGGSISEPTENPTIDPTEDPTEVPTVESTEDPTEEEIIPEEIFISEVYGSQSSLFARAIEIGNVGEKIDLTGYSIKISSGKRLVKEIKFESGESIDNNGTFVICNKDNDDYNYHSKGNLILEDNYINGSNYIEFVNPKGQTFDKIGSIYRFEYAVDQSYLRLPTKFVSNENFDELAFIKVRVDENYSYLGNLDCPFNNEEEILEGPKITKELYSYKFEDNSRPGGGFAKATVSSYGDGDTTVFRFNETFETVEITERTRYMFINCPEISHGSSPNIPEEGAEPRGYTAKLYNNEVLKNAKSILVQSVKGYGFREVYGRLLGFVWYSNKTNPELSDYKLLNYEMVYEGYASFGDDDKVKELYSNNIYYHTFFEYANIRAQKLGLKIYGETDPNYDY